MVIFVLILISAIAVLLAAAAWPVIQEGAEESAGKESGPGDVPAPAVPESLEGALVAQLTAGAINQRQYVRAMAFVAARDEIRHPMSVPTDD